MWLYRWLLVVCTTFVLLLVALAEVAEDDTSNEAVPYEEDSSMTEKRTFSSPSCRRCLHYSDDWGSCLECFSRPGAAPYYSGEKRANVDPYSWDVDKRANVNPYEWDIKRAINPYEWQVKRAYNPYEYKSFAGAEYKRDYNPYDYKSFAGAELDKKAYNPYEYKSFAGAEYKKAYNPYEYKSFAGAEYKRAYNPYDFELEKRGLSACRCCLRINHPDCCAKCNYAPYYNKRAYRTSYRPEYDEYCACCRKDRFNYACCVNCSLKRK